MPEAEEMIATRQKVERLADAPSPLGPSATFVFPPRLVIGYSAISFFVLSDQPFEVRVEQACSEDGPWTNTSTLSSTFDLVALVHRVCARIAPCGSHLRVTLANLSPSSQTILQVCIFGIPKAVVG